MPSYFNFDEMFERMRNAIGEVQKASLPFSASMFPVDLEDAGDKLILRADLPGVNKSDIKVKATPAEILIAAQTSQEMRKVAKNYFHQERRARKFERVLSLPSEIDPDKIKAKYENGVLTVEMMKIKDPRKKDIKID